MNTGLDQAVPDGVETDEPAAVNAGTVFKSADVRSPRSSVAFYVCGRLRQFALFSIGAMGLWPLALQLLLEPASVFGDGHGDRYEQLSYFAFENDHYQVLEPRQVSCSDLQATMFGVVPPILTQQLVRALPEDTFQTVRSLVVNQTTEGGFTRLSVNTGILGLSAANSVCFGGVDAEGAIQIEALLSAADASTFGLDAACLQGTASHMRLRLQSTEFYVPDTMGELNPSRTGGAMVIVSLVDANLKPVDSTCYAETRKARYAATQNESEYRRLVSGYSKQLLVADTCAEFTLFGGERDTFGCAYSALGTSGTVADLNSVDSVSFPAPWRMIQCTMSGECSSLLFTQLWLSEYTTQETTDGLVLRHNFVNHKVNEVTVDATISIRVLINLQIVALVVTAYLTSVRGWHKIGSAFVSPWTRSMNATTSCTIAKVVRSSYNFILVAQMVLGMVQWRKQLTIDLLVGADTNQAVLRAFGCGTLVVVLATNILFARAGDLKMQEMEPSFAHVVGFLTTVILFLITRTKAVAASTRSLLATGMHSVSAADVTQYSGCRGSSVCAIEASLKMYTVVLIVIIGAAAFIGLTLHTMLQASVRTGSKVASAVYRVERQSFALSRLRGERRSRSYASVNTFTRFLDDRSRSTSLYDCSTEIYVQDGEVVLSTRAQLEACGFVLASTILFRYRDLPLFLVARILPIQILNFFNLTVTTYQLLPTGKLLNGLEIVFVADQVIHTHWSKLKTARLDWMQGYYGGEDSNFGESIHKRRVSKAREEISAAQ